MSFPSVKQGMNKCFLPDLVKQWAEVLTMMGLGRENPHYKKTFMNCE